MGVPQRGWRIFSDASRPARNWARRLQPGSEASAAFPLAPKEFTTFVPLSCASKELATTGDPLIRQQLVQSRMLHSRFYRGKELRLDLHLFEVGLT